MFTKYFNLNNSEQVLTVMKLLFFSFFKMCPYPVCRIAGEELKKKEVFSVIGRVPCEEGFRRRRGTVEPVRSLIGRIGGGRVSWRMRHDSIWAPEKKFLLSVKPPCSRRCVYTEASTAACSNQAGWGWGRGWRSRFSLGGTQESAGWTR